MGTENKNKYLSLRRSLFDHWLWDQKPFGKGQAWIDLIRRANVKYKKFPVNGKMVYLKRGDLLTSIPKLAESWGWSISRTRRFLYTLRDDKMLVIKAASRYTILTIINYKELGDASNLYVNSKRSANKQQMNSKRSTNELQVDTINKSINNKDNNISSSSYSLVLYKGKKPDDDYFFIRFKEITGHDVYPKEIELLPEIFKHKKEEIERALVVMQKNRGSSIKYLLKVLQTIKDGPVKKPDLDMDFGIRHHFGCPDPDSGSKTGTIYKVRRSTKFYCQSCGKFWPNEEAVERDKKNWFQKGQAGV